jgi:hypothetical protein
MNLPGFFDRIEDDYSYSSFLSLMETLVAEGRTTGANQSSAFVHFTKLNLQRMHRWDKTLIVGEALKEKARLAEHQTWWILTEAWCGDSAQNLPLLAKVAEHSAGKIRLRILLRDEHLPIMDQYLTNGGRSIPRLVAMSTAGQELFTWGPRPRAAQAFYLDWKAEPKGRDHDAFERELHLWYAQDRSQSIQQELLQLL